MKPAAHYRYAARAGGRGGDCRRRRAQSRLEIRWTFVAWGNNDYNQTNLPPDLNDVIAIAAGDYHNLALKGDGTVVAWGYNEFAQTNVPFGLSNVVAIAANEYHSAALLLMERSAPGEAAIRMCSLAV